MVEAKIEFHSTYRTPSICDDEDPPLNDSWPSQSKPSAAASSSSSGYSICELLPHIKLNCRVEIVNLAGNFNSGDNDIGPDVFSSEMSFEHEESSYITFTVNDYLDEQKGNISDSVLALDIFIQHCEWAMPVSPETDQLHLHRLVTVNPYPTYFQISPETWNLVELEEGQSVAEIGMPLQVAFDFDFVANNYPRRGGATRNANAGYEYEFIQHHSLANGQGFRDQSLQLMKNDPLLTILVVLLVIMIVVFFDLMIFLLGETKPKADSYPKLLGLVRSTILYGWASVTLYITVGRCSLMYLAFCAMSLSISAGSCCIRCARASWYIIYHLSIATMVKVKNVGTSLKEFIAWSVLWHLPIATMVKVKNVGTSLKHLVSESARRVSSALQATKQKCSFRLQSCSEETETEECGTSDTLATPENMKKDSSCPSACDVTYDHTAAKSCLLSPSGSRSPRVNNNDAVDSDRQYVNPEASLFHPTQIFEHVGRHITSPDNDKYLSKRDKRDAQLSIYESMLVSNESCDSIAEHSFCRDQNSFSLLPDELSTIMDDSDEDRDSSECICTPKDADISEVKDDISAGKNPAAASKTKILVSIPVPIDVSQGDLDTTTPDLNVDRPDMDENALFIAGFVNEDHSIPNEKESHNFESYEIKGDSSVESIVLFYDDSLQEAAVRRNPSPGNDSVRNSVVETFAEIESTSQSVGNSSRFNGGKKEEISSEIGLSTDSNEIHVEETDTTIHDCEVLCNEALQKIQDIEDVQSSRFLVPKDSHDKRDIRVSKECNDKVDRVPRLKSTKVKTSDHTDFALEKCSHEITTEDATSSSNIGTPGPENAQRDASPTKKTSSSQPLSRACEEDGFSDCYNCTGDGFVDDSECSKHSSEHSVIPCHAVRKFGPCSVALPQDQSNYDDISQYTRNVSGEDDENDASGGNPIGAEQICDSSDDAAEAIAVPLKCLEVKSPCIVAFFSESTGSVCFSDIGCNDELQFSASNDKDHLLIPSCTDKDNISCVETCPSIIIDEEPCSTARSHRKGYAKGSPHFLRPLEWKESSAALSLSEHPSTPKIKDLESCQNSEDVTSTWQQKSLSSPHGAKQANAAVAFQSVQKELFAKLKSRSKLSSELEDPLPPQEPLSPCSQLENHLMQRETGPGKLKMPELFTKNRNERSSPRVIKPVPHVSTSGKNFSQLMAKWKKDGKSIEIDDKEMPESGKSEAKGKISSPFLENEKTGRQVKSKKIQPLNKNRLAAGGLEAKGGDLQKSSLSFLDDMLG